MAAHERFLAFLGIGPHELIVSVLSAFVVLALVVIAYVIGFRQTDHIDEAQLAALAMAEGASISAALVDPSGRRALARLNDGKLLIARVMGDGVGARVAAANAVAIRLKKDHLKITFGDLGFPPLSWRLNETPPEWLTLLTRESER